MLCNSAAALIWGLQRIWYILKVSSVTPLAMCFLSSNQNRMQNYSEFYCNFFNTVFYLQTHVWIPNFYFVHRHRPLNRCGWFCAVPYNAEIVSALSAHSSQLTICRISFFSSEKSSKQAGRYRRCESGMIYSGSIKKFRPQ